MTIVYAWKEFVPVINCHFPCYCLKWICFSFVFVEPFYSAITPSFSGVIFIALVVVPFTFPLPFVIVALFNSFEHHHLCSCCASLPSLLPSSFCCPLKFVIIQLCQPHLLYSSCCHFPHSPLAFLLKIAIKASFNSVFTYSHPAVFGSSITVSWPSNLDFESLKHQTIFKGLVMKKSACIYLHPWYWHRILRLSLSSLF